MYTIKIVRGNIVNVTTEAIVTSANNNLMPGGGLNKMIFYSAGDKLIEECSKLKYCETGKAVYTSGFNIPAKYIIHAVGPYWHGGYDNEARKLASCYISVMKIAEQLGVKSIAIPALCTGLGGYPLEEASDIAVASVVSYLQSHNLDIEVWFMCYDQETLINYRAKNMDGVNDISKYFTRKELKISTKLNNEEKRLLKKKMFQKEVSKENELAAVNLVLKRTIRKKYPDHVYLAAPKKTANITNKTCIKYGCSGPFIAMDCVQSYSYDTEKIKIKIEPFSFVDTPEELESKKKYFTDDDGNGIPDKYENQAHSNNQPKTIKVVNVESMLNEFGSELNTTEYVDVQQQNVEITDIEQAQEKLLPEESMPSLIREDKQEVQTIDDPVTVNNTENTNQNDTVSQKKKKKKKNN